MGLMGDKQQHTYGYSVIPSDGTSVLQILPRPLYSVIDGNQALVLRLDHHH